MYMFRMADQAEKKKDPMIAKKVGAMRMWELREDVC